MELRMKNNKSLIFSRLAIAVSSMLMLASCNIGQPTTRLGMVKDPETGLMFGSVIEKNIVTDASFYNNNKIKVRTRNTSGDLAFGLRTFTRQLEKAYAESGYEPVTGNDFGLLIDLNVRYSGQIQKNLAVEYSVLGAAAGGIAGYRSSANAGTAIGAVSGVTLGNILGSFITDDTYIIIADVTFAVVKKYRKSRKQVTFSRSAKLKNVDDPDVDEQIINRGFKKTYTTQISVYAGGRNVSQAEISGEVRKRIIRIAGDLI
jgi:uncharacterized protein YcfJ